MAPLYHYLYETIDLKTMGIALGLILLLTHGYAFLATPKVSAWLRNLPRNRNLGIAILAIDALWAFMVTRNMDLGEFDAIRRAILMTIPVGFGLVITFADEFLAVRAVGVFFLLAACPILEAAFLGQPTTRLLLPIFAYAIILKGLFWIGMPYLMRDGIAWITRNESRWKAACAAGCAYGIAMIVCAMAFY